MSIDKRYFSKFVDPHLDAKDYITAAVKLTKENSELTLRQFEDNIGKAFRWLALCRTFWLTTQRGLNDNEIRTFLTKTKMSLMYYRYTNALKSVDDSLLLAASGRYLTAGAALRTSLESMVRGAFVYGLLTEGLTALGSWWKGRKPVEGSTKSWPDYFAQASSDALGSSDSTAFEIVLEKNLIEDCKNSSDCEDPDLLPFAWMYRQLRQWGYLGSMSTDSDWAYKRIYETLCGYVHAALDNMDYWKAVKEKKGYQLLSGQTDSILLKRYTELQNMTLNLIGAIFFSAAGKLFQLPSARNNVKVAMNKEVEFRKDLPHIWATIEQSMDKYKPSALSSFGE